jgi:hypothetical protein
MLTKTCNICMIDYATPYLLLSNKHTVNYLVLIVSVSYMIRASEDQCGCPSKFGRRENVEAM